jgi:hypothetical protein
MLPRFLYMLALAFVLQMSAGIASAYCLHETGQASQHFGHHQHEHQASAGDEDHAAPNKKAASHPDCASCAHGAVFVAAWMAPTALALFSSHQQQLLPTGQAAPYLGLPERPNWMIAA